MPTKIVNGERRELNAEELAIWEAEQLAAAEYVHVPDQVTAYQAKAALHLAGHYASVQAIMADPDTDPLAVIAWENASNFGRVSPFIASIGPVLGLSESDIDQLFQDAAAIE